MVVLHAGPDDPSSGRKGDPAVREALGALQGLAVFGHCHWRDPLLELPRGQALNVDARVVVLTP